MIPRLDRGTVSRVLPILAGGALLCCACSSAPAGGEGSASDGGNEGEGGAFEGTGPRETAERFVRDLAEGRTREVLGALSPMERQGREDRLETAIREAHEGIHGHGGLASLEVVPCEEDDDDAVAVARFVTRDGHSESGKLYLHRESDRWHVAAGMIR